MTSIKNQINISVIIPCYNESGAVIDCLNEICNVLEKHDDVEIITVNDGSIDKTPIILDKYASTNSVVRVIHNETNIGYGASLKRGICEAKGEIIVITDSDGTYPASSIPILLEKLIKYEMAVGARTGSNVHVPLIRRPAKWVLLYYARWMARADIKDLNSGLRAFYKKHALRFFHLFPNGFSFTSTITLAMHINGLKVCYLPINYRKRIGKSSIRPIHDTIAFFSLVLRTTMYFRPLQVFGSLAALLLFSGLLTGVIGKMVWDLVPDVATVSLISTGLIFLGMGLIGDLMNTIAKSIQKN